MVQKLSSRQVFTNIFNLLCDLDLECSNPIFPHDTPAYNTLLSNQVWMQKDQQYRRYSKNGQVLIISALAVTLTLKIVNQIFRMTHCLMIIHHNTKFSKKIFFKVEWFRRYWPDTIRHTGILNICCDPDLVHSNLIFQQDTHAYDAVLSNQVCLQTDQLFRRYNRNSHILII